jgi:zinc D-Ala-D-Ala carboxypeptidase
MRSYSASSRTPINLHWPLLPAPLLNSTAFALRPALTGADRERYRQSPPSLENLSPTAIEARTIRVLRADLIEDKMRGGVIGSTCVMRLDGSSWASVRIQAMHDSDATRASVLRLLRAYEPRLECIDLDMEILSSADISDYDPLSLGARLSSELGVPEDYASQHRLSWIDEPERLHYAGRDYVGRTLWLQHGTMQAWQSMQRAALETGLRLEAVSGFRSIGYQASILRRKLDRGMSIHEVLAINTAPGYSEHHSGRAIDIGTPGCPPAQEVFENTPAFAWLRQHAAQFGFRMSYPRGNPHGVIYEPWHWYYHPT